MSPIQQWLDQLPEPMAIAVVAAVRKLEAWRGEIEAEAKAKAEAEMDDLRQEALRVLDDMQDTLEEVRLNVSYVDDELNRLRRELQA